jgi:hypothetical protein
LHQFRSLAWHWAGVLLPPTLRLSKNPHLRALIRTYPHNPRIFNAFSCTEHGIRNPPRFPLRAHLTHSLRRQLTTDHCLPAIASAAGPIRFNCQRTLVRHGLLAMAERPRTQSSTTPQSCILWLLVKKYLHNLFTRSTRHRRPPPERGSATRSNARIPVNARTM